MVGSYTEVFITEVGVEKAAIFIRSYNTTRTFFRGEINPLCFAFPFTFTEEPDAFKVCQFKELNKGFLFFAIFLFNNSAISVFFILTTLVIITAKNNTKMSREMMGKIDTPSIVVKFPVMNRNMIIQFYFLVSFPLLTCWF